MKRCWVMTNCSIMGIWCSQDYVPWIREEGGAEWITAVQVCVCVREHTLSIWISDWQVKSVISLLKLFEMSTVEIKNVSGYLKWLNWPEGREIRVESLEHVRGWKTGRMEGKKSKKRDSYYRAGCRGRLFSPSSLCGRKTTIGGLGESQS